MNMTDKLRPFLKDIEDEMLIFFQQDNDILFIGKREDFGELKEGMGVIYSDENNNILVYKRRAKQKYIEILEEDNGDEMIITEYGGQKVRPTSKSNNKYLKRLKEMRLTIEPIPSSAHGKNLRTQVRGCRWKRLRELHFKQQGGRCGICGKQAPLQLHEIWEYNDKKHILTLTGFIGLCGYCHGIKHYFRSKIVYYPEDLIKLEKHFMDINRLSPGMMSSYVVEVGKIYDERDKNTWAVSMGVYEKYIVEKEEYIKEQITKKERTLEEKIEEAKAKHRAYNVKERREEKKLKRIITETTRRKG